MEGIEEIVREFLIESYENLDQLDQDLVALESDPGSTSLLGSVFRTIHTIKGTSGFLAFAKLEAVTHVGESLLVQLRDGQRGLDQRITDALLEMVDSVRALLAQIDAHGTENGVDTTDVVARIQAILDGSDDGEAAVEQESAAADAAVSDAADAGGASSAEQPAGRTTPDDTTADAPPTPSAEPADAPPALAEPAEPRPSADDASPGEPAHAPAGRTAPTSPAPASGRSSSESSIRVDVDVLDELMRQVGELVLVRNQIAQITDTSAGPELARASQRLSLIAGELQDGVMKTRMQPIDHIWTKFPRVVRDLSVACNRVVDLEMVGGDTEVDRGLLEAVKDPLTHLIRNAVDHGIEDPAVRVAQGKSERGVIGLRAYHAGGQVVVEVTDDGKGLDPVRIAAKAVERGIRTAEQLDAMTSTDILNLVFLPGFSTASAVTNVSGRGVGMDVVRANIEAIGGQVEVESEVGRGTTWRLRMPLTLAIMPVLTVGTGTDLYAIAQTNVVELVAITDEKAVGSIEYVNDAEVYRLRGELLPLVRLSDVLGTEARATGQKVVTVLQADGQRFGLVVDLVRSTEEIVVKPLATQLKSAGTYAGSTLLGDGRVVLILDIPAIARRCLRSEIGEAAAAAAAALTRQDGEDQLVVTVGGGQRAAVPLSAVTRLEQVDPARLESFGDREMLQYRESIVPVARRDGLRTSLGAPDGDEARLTVLMFSRAGRTVAVVVDEIVEIVNDEGVEPSATDAHGVLGLMVLDGKVTQLLDVTALLLSADPYFYDDVVDQAEAQLPTPGVLESAGAR